MTHAELHQAIRRAHILQVQEWLQWTELELGGYVFKQGCDYLRLQVPDERDYRVILPSSEYWGWWKIQLAMRDEQFLLDCEAARNLSGILVAPCGILTEVANISSDYSPNILRTLEGRRTRYRVTNNANNLFKCPAMESSYAGVFMKAYNRR